MPKLTLSIASEIIEEAKELAADRHTSVSALFSRYIHSQRGKGKRNGNRISPRVKAVSGIVKLPRELEGKTDRELLTEALMERHGQE